MRIRSLIGIMFRAFFLSFEFVTIAGGVVIYCLAPSTNEMLASIGADREGYRYVCFIPVGLFAFCVKFVNDILSPSHEMRPQLVDWNSRYVLKVYCFAALAYAMIGAIGGIMVFLCKKEDIGSCVLVAVVSILVSFFATASAYFAKHKFLELLDKMKICEEKAKRK